MPDALLSIFNVCFLVLLYLFFFRVLRAVWSEVSSTDGSSVDTDASPSRRERRRAARAERSDHSTPPEAEPVGPSVLVALEPPQLAGIEYPLHDGLSMGRAADAGISIEDSVLSQHHAELRWHDGGWVIADLGSTNGTYLNNVKVDQMARIEPGDRLQVGNVILELR